MYKISALSFLIIFLLKSVCFGYIEDYEKLLSKYTRYGIKEGIGSVVVDYESWGDDKRHKRVMEELVKMKVKVLRGDLKKAFWINAYNILTIDLILRSGEKESIRNQSVGGVSPWDKYRWRIGDKAYTLNEIEHKILVPLGDPRIHFVLNCGALSCPDLLRQPYKADKLERQLEEQSKRFLNDTVKGVRFVRGGGAYISEIFRWYSDDFGGRVGVMRFIVERISLGGGKFSIRGYIPYNWGLNDG